MQYRLLYNVVYTPPLLWKRPFGRAGAVVSLGIDCIGTRLTDVLCHLMMSHGVCMVLYGASLIQCVVEGCVLCPLERREMQFENGTSP